ncbi:hypothetical protein, partial [Collimonas humicola]|uniref:hypothetical protein n=1 Tax=Collimonas humicola TaxID=2825886 RepID=UPI001B8D240B
DTAGETVGLNVNGKETVNAFTQDTIQVGGTTYLNFGSTQGGNSVTGVAAGATINDVSAGNNTLTLDTAGETVGLNVSGKETVNAFTQDTIQVGGTTYLNFGSTQGGNSVTGVASGATINDVSAGNNTLTLDTAGETVGLNVNGKETVNAFTQDTIQVGGTTYLNFGSTQGGN